MATTSAATASTSASTSTPLAPMPLPEIVPLSLPSILVNPRLKQLATGSSPSVKPRATRREAREDEGAIGKRRRRRWENASLRANPHAAAPALRDLYPGPQLEDIEPVFPAPPPKAFVTAPGERGLKPVSDPRSEEYGQFTQAIKGVRRAMKPIVQGGGRAADVINALETELAAWLDANFVLHAPDSPASPSRRCIYAPSLAEDEELPPNTPDLRVFERSRSPANMLLEVPDAFTRLLVHYTARFWNIVSFSKTDVTGTRLTYLLRPRMPAALARTTMLTPPTTDLDGGQSTEPPSSAVSEAGDEFSTDDEGWTDLGGREIGSPASLNTPRTRMPSHTETSCDEADDEDGLASSLDSLDIASPTPTRSRRPRRSAPVDANVDIHSRSSSPSPSRARRQYSTRQTGRKAGHRGGAWHPPSMRFMEYLLA